jgi:hypothetical protein
MPLVPYIYKHSSAQNVQALYRAADNQWKQLVILPGRTGREMASQERERLNSPIAATGRGHLTQDNWVIALMDAELPGLCRYCERSKPISAELGTSTGIAAPSNDRKGAGCPSVTPISAPPGYHAHRRTQPANC